jgi:hypothetical protein
MTTTPDGPPAPAEYLLSWHDILAALGKRNSPEARRQVRRLNDQHLGPILFPRRGGQPRVERGELLRWWNGLKSVWAEADRLRREGPAVVAGRVRARRRTS